MHTSSCCRNSSGQAALRLRPDQVRRREQGHKRLPRSLPGGVRADVVILSREGLSELIAAKKIAPGTDVDLARVPLGVGVRVGTPKPDVSTVESFKQVLLKAKTIAMPGSTSGIWLTNDLFPRRRAAPTQPAWSRPEPQTSQSCQLVKLCMRQASTWQATSHRRSNSSRRFQPLWLLARERSKILNV